MSGWVSPDAAVCPVLPAVPLEAVFPAGCTRALRSRDCAAPKGRQSAFWTDGDFLLPPVPESLFHILFFLLPSAVWRGEPCVAFRDWRTPWSGARGGGAVA